VWLVSRDILEEYTDVLRRLGVKRSTVGRVVNLLAEGAERVRDSPAAGLSPDPGDEPFCSCAESGAADFLVTLNPKDFPQHRLSATVIAPGIRYPGRGVGRPDRDVRPRSCRLGRHASRGRRGQLDRALGDHVGRSATGAQSIRD
jgi:hypothetical protein